MTVVAVPGKIVWLLIQSQNSRILFLSDLEWFVMASENFMFHFTTPDRKRAVKTVRGKKT